VLANFRDAGIVRVQEATINQLVPESSLAIARLDVTLSNSGLIIPSDEGLWARVRAGLSNSLLAIFWRAPAVNAASSTSISTMRTFGTCRGSRRQSRRTT